MVRVFPFAPAPPWPALLATVGAVLVWGGLRSGWATAGSPGGPLVPWLLHAVLLGVLGVLALRTWTSVRRGQQVLEVYVGKRFLELVYSRGGETVATETVELVRLEDAERGASSVRLLLEGEPAKQLPMARHSDEARGWMVEHLRGAGLGARRRFGHLPDGGSLFGRPESTEETPTPS